MCQYCSVPPVTSGRSHLFPPLCATRNAEGHPVTEWIVAVHLWLQLCPHYPLCMTHILSTKCSASCYCMCLLLLTAKLFSQLNVVYWIECCSLWHYQRARADPTSVHWGWGQDSILSASKSWNSGLLMYIVILEDRVWSRTVKIRECSTIQL